MTMMDRFNDAIRAVPKLRIRLEEAETEDPAEVLAYNIGSWACASECADLFLPWLEERIEAHDEAEALSARSHPDLLMAKGRRMEAKDIRDQFLLWRGTSRKTPA